MLHDNILKLLADNKKRVYLHSELSSLFKSTPKEIANTITELLLMNLIETVPSRFYIDPVRITPEGCAFVTKGFRFAC